MTFIQSVILGLVQGVTEFLPISSSGHLILTRVYLGISENMSLPFDVMLHLATLLAILIYYSKDIIDLINELRFGGIKSRGGKMLLSIIVGSIPAGVMGFLWSDWFENAFRNPNNVAYSLILGSLVFLAADWFERNKNNQEQIYNDDNDKPLGLWKSILVGFFQAGALIPGMSRSGLSISGGIFAGLNREEAIRFAFLLGVPTIAGAGLKTILDIQNPGAFFLDPYIYTGAVVAFVSGLISIKFLVKFLKSNSFNVFVVYRILLALAIIKLL